MKKSEIRVAGFIREANWSIFPEDVKKQAIKCIIDLFGCIAAGAMTPTSKLTNKLVFDFFKGDDATVLTDGKRASLPGAALANGIAVNAFDVDDGHRMIKGHPGAAVFPALLAAAEYRDITYTELLTALVVSYEVAIRAGLAVHSHYGFYHGSGSWGAIGSAAGVSKIFSLDDKGTLEAMGIAEYNAPLAPVMRPVQIPSMNKDGIAWGTMTGITAVLMAREGYTGKPGVLDYPEFNNLVDSLGIKYKILDLYFKPYTCCRWAHPSVSAVIYLKNRYSLKHEDIEKVSIFSFGAADSLYKEKPTNTEEAQYNVIYPVAAALVAGEVGPRQVLEEYINNKVVLGLMDRISLVADERFEKEFPSKRLCEVEIETKDGCKLRSGVFHPVGEPDEPVSLEWIIQKFKWLTRDVMPERKADALIEILTSPDKDIQVRDIIEIYMRS